MQVCSEVYMIPPYIKGWSSMRKHRNLRVVSVVKVQEVPCNLESSLTINKYKCKHRRSGKISSELINTPSKIDQSTYVY